MTGDAAASTAGNEPDDATVLVVDDDASIRALFTAILETEGFRVRTAGDGQAALEELDIAPVDLVLLDARMPRLDGLSTLQRLREQPATCILPVIVVTGSGDVVSRVTGLDAGADDYLVKPIHPDELVARVRAQLRSRDEWRKAVRERLETRAELARTLGQLEPGEDAADTACRISATIQASEPALQVAIVGFTSAAAVPLATTSVPRTDRRPGPALPRSVGTHLRDRARDQAWVQQRREQPGEVDLALFGPDVRAAAYAPLRTGQRVTGLLAIGARERVNEAGDLAELCLAMAIDFAPLVAALLAPHLAVGGEVRTRRDRILTIIGGHEFTPVFQPVVDLRTGSVVGYEALTRFGDGLPPHEHFRAAADVGLGIELEAATAGAAVRASCELADATWVSLNVSPEFLSRTDTVDFVTTHCPHPLVLELTEHDPIDDYAAMRQALADLATDVRLSVDDAGSGYACLRHVLQLVPAFVKLDRNWVRGIDSDPSRQALVAGLRHFAERSQCTLIAEGVERETELAILRELDVPLGQGFLLGHPEPV